MNKLLIVWFLLLFSSGSVSANELTKSGLKLLLVFDNSAVKDYPFSDTVNWGKKSQRHNWEKYFKKSGMEIQTFDVLHPQSNKSWAEKEEFTLFKKNGVVVGYGIIFTNVRFFGYAVNKESGDVREITIQKVEILYDLRGKYIFLATYQTNGLSDFEMFMGEFLGHEPRAKRKDIDIYHLNLGEGYQFDDKSFRLAEFLLNFSKECKQFFDQNSMIDGKLSVPLDEDLFKSIER